MDIKYAPTDLDKTVEETAHLKQSDCRLYQSLFEKYEDLFNIKLKTLASTSSRSNTISWQSPSGSKLAKEETKAGAASMYNLEYCTRATDQNEHPSTFHTRKGWSS